MSDERNDGGPAFPIEYSPLTDGEGKPTPASTGMSLRDYFAGQYIIRAATHRPSNAYHWLRWFLGFSYHMDALDHEQMCRNAYRNADEMLKQRKK